MTKYTATFHTVDLTITSSRVKDAPSVHAWLAEGTLKSGRPWRLHGFSISAAGALARMTEDTRHFGRQGAKTTLQEIVPATVVNERVAA